MAYKLTIMRPDGKPSATLRTTSPVMVAATLEGWLDKAPPAWFDVDGELTVQMTHHGEPLDTAVLAEHIAQFRDLTGDTAATDAARRGNPRRQRRDG